MARALGVFYNGASIGKDRCGRPITDENFLLCFDSHDEPVAFTLPPEEYSPQWEVVMDTADQRPDTTIVPADACLDVAGKSVCILGAHTPSRRDPITPWPRPWPP